MVGKLVGRMELTRHLVGNNELIPRLLEKGVIEQRPDGTFDRDECREKYIRHLRARPPRGTGNAKLLEARTKLAELRVAERTHKVVSTEEVTAALQFLASTCANIFDGLPYSIAEARSNPVLRATLTDWVRRSRNHVADAMEAHAASLEATGESADSTR
jgi:phage terminase Nu1 subunit (DNA packaging protein)